MTVRARMVGASAVFLAAGLLLTTHAPTSSATTEVVFAYTGANQTWTVPAGVTSVEISILGAGGAGGRAGGGSTSFGGGGGVVSGTLTVVPGDTLTIIVGQGGINDNVREPLNRNYRFGGGASGAGDQIHGTFAWGSGGGRSAVRSSNALYSTTGDLLTAGAGGGGGWHLARGAGGAGGGLAGSAGGRGDTDRGGGGGTQDNTGGAAGGPSEPGVGGIQYAGGYAVITGASEAGGGGGGYYGGGGAGNNGGGGGGSSFLGTAAYFTGSTTAGAGRTPGTSTWPSACGTTPGRGADPGNSSLVGQGGNGCVVLRFASSSNGSAPTGVQPLDPAPWLQAYARPTSASTCLPGWSPSWAMWPNNNTGGFTCERRIEYVSGDWQAKPGYHD